ncbi:hypothetical protein GCM10020295_15990 [Streptomyces cinereospinus]
MVANAGELGVDSGRVVVGGTSAGGALTAAVTLASRDLDGPAVRHQMLLYPVTDHAMRTRSMREFDATPGWHARNNVHMWRHYLGTDEPEKVSPYAAPAEAGRPVRAAPGLPDDHRVRPAARRGGSTSGAACWPPGSPCGCTTYPAPSTDSTPPPRSPRSAGRALDEQCAVLARATGTTVVR